MLDSPGATHPTARPAPDTLAPYLPDLLHIQPSLVLDHAAVARALCIAFATGDAEQSLERVMDGARVCESSWTGSSFREGLYMPVLVSRCMPVQIDGFCPKLNQGYLLRLLENPPSDPRSRDFRRAILAELVARPDYRKSFEAVYMRLHKLRTELQALDSVGYYDSRVRRLFVLSLLRDLFEDLRDRFAGATSGLSRITAYAAYVCQTPGYKHLCDLLQYEDRLSTVQFRMRIGSDGTLRRFEVVDVQENHSNPFYQRPIRRLLSKLGLWWRGYRIGESGLLDAWLEEVFAGVVPYLPAMLRLFGDQEFYLAGLGFRDLCQQHGLRTSFPTLVPAGSPRACMRVEGLFNPLLLQSARPVPCDLDGESLACKTILTGPNSGGKTRLLQALGLVQILAESGLYAPVAAATLPRAHGLLVSLVEEGRVDQCEGRLGMELIRIRQLFERAQVGSLVILDELCSGTNPSEGEEIFRLVLSLLEQLDARAVIATHFLDFARRLEAEADADAPLRLAFLQVDVGADDRPTYQFRPGVARTSMAQQTAQRLGVTDAVLRALVQRQRQASPVPRPGDARSSAPSGLDVTPSEPTPLHREPVLPPPADLRPPLSA